MSEPGGVPRVGVAVDVVCCRLRPSETAWQLEVLLVRRLPPPFAWQWALPGGVLHADERLADCARRLLRERTGLVESYLEQLYTFDALDRDPLGRTLSVAYYALFRLDASEPEAGRNVAAARWWAIHHLPAGGMLAFDHARIIQAAHERLRHKLDYAPVAFQMLPPSFTMTQLRRVYEAIQERPYDPTNFPRAMQARFPGLTVVPGQHDRASKRPARLFRYDASPTTLSAGR
ncbi:MAG TPA: NUDIX domain-containing protein [Chloroflexota bacterium]|nr:NUDIX domain-containing protein [Chloroflexota bacterium]